MREARAAMGLDHANVVPVYGAGEADGQLFIADAPHRRRRPASRSSTPDGPLTVERVLTLVRQIAGGLDAAARERARPQRCQARAT